MPRITTTRQQRRALKTENAKQPKRLTLIRKDQWPKDDSVLRMAVWRNRDYLVQAFKEPAPVRLSVNRTKMQADGRWADAISWDELQEIKRLIGYGEHCAVEIYPKDRDIVDVANMRHLWIPDQELNFGWKNEDSDQ